MDNKLFLPHSEQFDEMNSHLAKISKILGAQTYTSSWKGIQNAVRAGVAPEFFPVGTQLLVHHDVYGDRLYDVVAHDHYKSAVDENAHTMTLMSHDVLFTAPFDHSEALYQVENELPPGTYKFTVNSDLYIEPCWAGTFNFTVTKEIPAEFYIAVTGSFENGPTSVRIYEVPNTQSADLIWETALVVQGDEGVSLGELHVELNSWERVMEGSNNYKESGIRQRLNSFAEYGEWWRPQTKFDIILSQAAQISGFMKGFDDEFLSVLGKVIVPCVANNVYEAPDSKTKKGEKYTVSDLFYLASESEIFGYPEMGGSDGSKVFQYYAGATSADRIKYTATSGAAAGYYLRSPYIRTSYGVLMTSWNGEKMVAHPDIMYGIAPVCNIV